MECKISLARYLLIEKLEDFLSSELELAFQDEVAGIEYMNFQIFKVALIRMRSGLGEDIIVLPPDDNGRRLMFAK